MTRYPQVLVNLAVARQAAARGAAGRAAGDRRRRAATRRRRARAGALLRHRVQGARDDRGDRRGAASARRPTRSPSRSASPERGDRLRHPRLHDLRLYVNVDHVATLRQRAARRYPDPVAAATLCELAGADGITVHLREDRRHIQDRDVRVLRETVRGVLNLEMAATDEMLRIAREVKPDFCTLVPEKREERTTEGGLDVARGRHAGDGGAGAARRRGSGSACSSIPSRARSRRRARLGVSTVELHTGDYCDAAPAAPEAAQQLQRLELAARAAADAGLRLGAGHGLDYANVGPVAALPELEELNIGHGIVARAVLLGMRAAVEELRAVIAGRRRERERGLPAAPHGSGDARRRRSRWRALSAYRRCGSWRRRAGRRRAGAARAGRRRRRPGGDRLRRRLERWRWIRGGAPPGAGRSLRCACSSRRREAKIQGDAAAALAALEQHGRACRSRTAAPGRTRRPGARALGGADAAVVHRRRHLRHRLSRSGARRAGGGDRRDERRRRTQDRRRHSLGARRRQRPRGRRRLSGRRDRDDGRPQARPRRRRVGARRADRDRRSRRAGRRPDRAGRALPLARRARDRRAHPAPERRRAQGEHGPPAGRGRLGRQDRRRVPGRGRPRCAPGRAW